MAFSVSGARKDTSCLLKLSVESSPKVNKGDEIEKKDHVFVICIGSSSCLHLQRRATSRKDHIQDRKDTLPGITRSRTRVNHMQCKVKGKQL
jgi:hypothetical protein